MHVPCTYLTHKDFRSISSILGEELHHPHTSHVITESGLRS